MSVARYQNCCLCQKNVTSSCKMGFVCTGVVAFSRLGGLVSVPKKDQNLFLFRLTVVGFYNVIHHIHHIHHRKSSLIVLPFSFFVAEPGSRSEPLLCFVLFCPLTIIIAPLSVSLTNVISSVCGEDLILFLFFLEK